MQRNFLKYLLVTIVVLIVMVILITEQYYNWFPTSNYGGDWLGFWSNISGSIIGVIGATMIALWQADSSFKKEKRLESWSQYLKDFIEPLYNIELNINNDNGLFVKTNLPDQLDQDDYYAEIYSGFDQQIAKMNNWFYADLMLKEIRYMELENRDSNLDRYIDNLKEETEKLKNHLVYYYSQQQRFINQKILEDLNYERHEKNVERAYLSSSEQKLYDNYHEAYEEVENTSENIIKLVMNIKNKL